MLTLSVKARCNTDHPKFEEDLETLQADAHVTIYEFYQNQIPLSSGVTIAFNKSFSPSTPMARDTKSQADAFLERVHAFASFEIISAWKEISYPVPWGILSDGDLPRNAETATDVREGQRVHEPLFEDGDFGDVEIVRESVDIDEVLAKIEECEKERSLHE